MRTLALILLAACGGAATTPSVKPVSSTASATEEDWGGYLAQLAGPSCPWIPGASFLVCKLPDDGSFSLVGWEPNNRRYVYWLVDPQGTVTVLPGVRNANDLAFEGGNLAIKIGKGASGWAIHAKVPGGNSVFDAQLATAAAAPPAPAPTRRSDVDWRSALQPLEGTWTFDGTGGGKPARYTETCRWITGATFLACKLTGGTGLSLMGWEPHNQRFVHYGISPAGQPLVLVGKNDAGSWTFTGPSVNVTMTRVTALEFKFVAEEAGVTVLDGTYTTKPGEVE